MARLWKGGAMVRVIAVAVSVIVLGACGDSSSASVERCRQLEAGLGPADAWADIAALQQDVAEWESLGCDDLLADR